VRVQAAMDKQRQEIYDQCRYEIRMAKGNRETISEAYAKKRAALKELGKTPVIDRVWSTPNTNGFAVNQGWSASTASRHGRWTDQQEGQDWAWRDKWKDVVLTTNKSSEKLTDETLKSLVDISDGEFERLMAEAEAEVNELERRRWWAEEWEKRKGPIKTERKFVLSRVEDVVGKVKL